MIPAPDDTQPISPTRRQRTPRWVFGILIVFTSLSLVATLGWWSHQSAAPTATLSPLAGVTLVIEGRERAVQTRAQTVGGLLAEQGVTLAPEDAISHLPQTPISAAMQITIDRARAVTLVIDGETRTLRTPFDNPYDILRQAGIALSADDAITLDGTAASADQLLLWPVPVLTIDIRRAVTVTVSDGGADVTFATTAETVGDALFEADIPLFLTDDVQPPLSAPLTGDTRITINRAAPLFIDVGGEIIETRVQGETVGAALAESGISLGGLDTTVPGEDAPITAGMTVRVIRVTEDILTATEPVPYETVYQADPDLPLDERRTVSAGQDGLREIYTRVRYADGEEIAREDAGSEIVQPPVNAVIAYGTQIVMRTVETPDGPRQYWRKLRVYATSYHPAALGGDNITAIGETLRKGIIGADPDLIPYRTNLYVPGYGTGIMADTGGPRSSPYWIDLGYSDADWVGWSRYVDVYLLAPVPDNIDYLLPPFTPIR